MITTPSSSEFVNLITPLGDRLSYYDRTQPPSNQPRNSAVTDPAKAVPQSFLDAMIVRQEVFVHEQHVPLENEADDDDRRSFHWVAYASIPTKSTSPPTSTISASSTSQTVVTPVSTKIPIGTIRLIPPPHPPHENDAAGWDKHGTEAYVKLGRLAVIPEFRKAGIAKLLIDTALAYARENPLAVGPAVLDPVGVEAKKKVLVPVAVREEDGLGVVGSAAASGSDGRGSRFRGLVLVHSQVGASKVWARHGFEKDEEMGEWDEEGIMHVGMWKRLEVSGEARRKSTIWATGQGID